MKGTRRSAGGGERSTWNDWGELQGTRTRAPSNARPGNQPMRASRSTWNPSCSAQVLADGASSPAVPRGTRDDVHELTCGQFSISPSTMMKDPTEFACGRRTWNGAQGLQGTPRSGTDHRVPTVACSPRNLRMAAEGFSWWLARPRTSGRRVPRRTSEAVLEWPHVVVDHGTCRVPRGTMKVGFKASRDQASSTKRWPLRVPRGT